MQFVSSAPHFNDTLDSLKNEYSSDATNSVVILGAHDLSRHQSFEYYKNKYDKVIVFNQEPLLAEQRNFLHPLYYYWLKKADEVWDYDEENIKVLSLIRDDVKLHILKPYKDWSAYCNSPKDIDILFYGSMNAHRKRVIDALSTKYKVVTLHTFDSLLLDRYISRSRILLNIHFYDECALQEQARMIRWIGSPCRIVSEKSVTNYLGVEELSYAELFTL